jgi:DNA polymerase
LTRDGSSPSRTYMTTLSLDFETRSTVDLRRAGIYVYAQHPDTDINCVAYAVDDQEPELWVPGQPQPDALLYLPTRPDTEMRAWNAQFERVIWAEIMVRRYGFPEVPLPLWYDTAADAAAMALPRSLEDCAAVLGVSQQKDVSAWRLMVRLSRPRQLVNGKPVWWNDPARNAVLYNYCKQDVRTERAIAKATRRLDLNERAIYLLDQKINEAGVYIDVPLARAMKRISELGLERANQEIAVATEGAVTAVTKTGDLRAWLGDNGVEVESVRKSVVRDLLEGEHPTPVRRALEARADAGRASVAKIDAILRARCVDGRVRGMLLYHGANTGRWAGRLAQPQNFPRPIVKDPEQWIDAILRGDYDYIDAFDPPLAVVASLLRGTFRASPDHVLRVADFSGIEARVLNWLAGQQDMVELFASGGKVYERMAARIYGVPEAEIVKGDPRRQIGKNTELGCGYQMGAEKFRATVLEQEGVDIGEQLSVDAVTAYRAIHPMVVRLWYALENAALDAVDMPGKVVEERGCKFVVRGAYLWLVLPSGRPLAYAHPKIKTVLTPWNEQKEQVTAEGVDSLTKRWRRRHYYGGLWTENVVQALARDLLAGAMRRIDADGHRVVLTVHDEVVADDPAGFSSLQSFLNLMTVVPEWARGCPINAEGWEGERYRK